MLTQLKRETPANDPEAPNVQLLLETLYDLAGADFRSYAYSSLKRRVVMQVLRENAGGIAGLDKLVRHEPSARERLIAALTIHVTAMFRDPAFHRLLPHGRDAGAAHLSLPAASGSRAARRARKSIRSPSCCRRKGFMPAAATTPPTSTSRCCRKRARASSRSRPCRNTRAIIRGPAGAVRSRNIIRRTASSPSSVRRCARMSSSPRTISSATPRSTNSTASSAGTS